MRAVNLLPKDAERARRTTPDPALLIGVAGFAVVVAALLSMYISSSQNVQDKQGHKSDLQSELTTLNSVNPRPKVLQIQESIASEEQSRIQAVSTALSYRIPWDNILGQIATIVPDGVKLTTLQATSPVSPNSSSSNARSSSTEPGLTITGWTYAQESIFLLQNRLSVLSPLKNVQFMSSQWQAGNPSYYTFTLTAEIDVPAGAAAVTASSADTEPSTTIPSAATPSASASGASQ
jgi:Tfp pilus assembly protein PilN